MKSTRRPDRPGIAHILALFLVVIFSVLAISLFAMSNVNIQSSVNHRDMSQAQALAESGLEYAQNLFQKYTTVATSFYTSEISDEQATSVFTELTSFLRSELSGQAIIDYQTLPNVTTFTEGSITGKQLVVPAATLTAATPGHFIIQFRQYDDTPGLLEVTSQGIVGDINRQVQLTYTIAKDDSLLKYAIMSKSRVIITGNSTIDGDVLCTWDDADAAPPFVLSPESTVNGTLGVTVSQSDWPANEVEGTSEGVLYDQPDIDDFGWENFDTTCYYEQTSAIRPSQSSGQIKEYFPHAPGDYTQPIGKCSTKVIRRVYENETFTDRQVSAGSDVLFKDCVFEGILYVGNTGGGLATNNVRFENCDFNGIIVTTVPNRFTGETWKKSVLYFTGDNTFNNTSQYPEATIIAPNFNVNIGNTHTLEDVEACTLTGLIVGGVVDIRGNVHVDGTILSIVDPVDMDDPEEIGTNVGFSNENIESNDAGVSGNITISPSPDNLLPMGIRTDTVIIPNTGSYTEF